MNTFLSLFTYILYRSILNNDIFLTNYKNMIDNFDNFKFNQLLLIFSTIRYD
jgi:hypothetical protein